MFVVFVIHTFSLFLFSRPILFMQTSQIDNDLSIETLQLRKAALIFRAINHPLRQQMLQLLHKSEKMPVTNLYVKLKLEQSVASQQLAILRKVGFVTAKRQGKQIFYSVNYSRLNDVTKHAKALNHNNPL